MRIENSEGFGMAFNCIIRLYKGNSNKELLALLHRICDEYLEWFHLQTIFCAIRDLLCGKYWNDEYCMSEDQKQGVELLLQRLVKQYILMEYSRCSSDSTKEEILYEMGRQVGFIPGVYEKVRFQSFEIFMEWINAKRLDEVYECRVNLDKKTLPIKKSFVQDFGKICLLIVQYSLERETHIRYICYTFIYHNVKLLEGKMIIEIQKYIQKVKNDENEMYWRNLENVLEKEIQRRRLLKVYEKIYKNEKMLRLMLVNSVRTDTLVSFEECQEMQWRIMVFEEFIKEQKMSKEKLQCQKFIERAKKMICDELKRYTNV